ncbi:hypothetical protein DYBT9275_04559 [Dyadobacter sp. CECT 9275]|uniref:Dystroglycan-type cadherin-like domain-containing protein n=1 Tax=Dyadobacter helix TaxID=2822344 RepID=A0A916JG06_9BACT|nr:putative Ig domain-containing protein [Dyadobacter sp. CECT 9275]CAG5009735.1 hypothetical protein DYBT9275_04559 [Dyadobacter sp. CECT 9275]
MAPFSCKLTQCRTGFILLLILSTYFKSLGQETATTESTDNQRYLALMLLNLPVEKGPEVEIIRMGQQYGMNAVYLTIPWDKVYYTSPTDPPNWEKYDEQIKTATGLGMKIALRIHIGRHNTRINGFWDASDSQISDSGKPLLGGYQDTSFGFDNQPIVDKAVGFVKEVVSRYKYLQAEKKLLFVSVTNTPTQEGEYPGGIITDGKETAAGYDYSPRMVKGFRAFLKEHYTKIERLNFLWGTTFKSFDDPAPPSTPWEPGEAFRQRFGKDWYIYRHMTMKKFVEQMVSAVKGIDPGIKYVSDYGSVFDLSSVVRGTIGYKDLNKKTDGIKVNDALSAYDHRWSVDILKSDSPPNFITANELFVSQYYDNNTHQKQITENFEHGANVVAVVVSTIAQMQRSEPFLRSSSSVWLNRPMEPIVYQDSVSYRMSAAVEKRGASSLIYDQWAKKAYADPARPRPVRIRLNEDLLSDEYWKDASNYPPYVLQPIPMQIIPVNKDFAYRLPTNAFADVDGTIVRMEVESLPSWLKYEGGQLKGRPATIADYRITVKGIDDEGGTTEAFFTIRVDTRENANKPPTVNSNFSNQTIAINKEFSLPIPPDAFIDVDGKITKVEAKDLPDWLKFTNGGFVGTPVKLGEYRVFLKAYDDLNAFVETYFTIRVVEPHMLNSPPFAFSTLPIKYASLNHPFSFVLPNVFGDNDGYISSITIQNRPSWLNFSLNQFSGTPTEEGEYRLIIRAFDNGGAYVDLPFILIVEIPRLRFELVRGGKAIDQQIIRKLEGDDVIPYSILPPLLNIYAYGNFDYDQVIFELNGPYRKRSVTSKFPYALYENESGFPAFAGRYTLTVTATNKDSSVVTNSIQFGISYGDSVNITRDIKEWQFYPNPTENIVNIKLPESQSNINIQYALVTISGKKIPVNTHVVHVSDNLASVDVGALGIPSGIYFLRLEKEGVLLQQFKIFKK